MQYFFLELEGLIMAKLVLAYPELNETDFHRIQTFREEYDEFFFKRVRPHFTFVFSVNDMTEKDFKEEIQKQSHGLFSFLFTFRCAVLDKDSLTGAYNVFLVPDEGYSRVIKFHDTLYSGKLREHKRLTIDFFPFMGIGCSKDSAASLKMIESWNKKDFEIKGRISVLDLVEFDGQTIETFEQIRLTPLVTGGKT